MIRAYRKSLQIAIERLVTTAVYISTATITTTQAKGQATVFSGHAGWKHGGDLLETSFALASSLIGCP